MPTESIPSGWLTVQEAAAASGMSEEEVRRIAARIRPGSTYTIMGITLERLKAMKVQGGIVGLRSDNPESLPVIQGDQLKSLHRGRIVLNAEMVEWWKRVKDHKQELRMQGCRTTEEIASEHGLTVREVMQAVKRLDKQEERRGVGRDH